MNNLKISLKLILAFGIAIACMILLGFTSYIDLNSLKSGQNSMYQCAVSVETISDIDSKMRDIRGEVANLSNEYFKDEVETRLANVAEDKDAAEALLDTYEEHLDGTTADAENLAKLRTLVDAYITSVDPIGAAARAGDFAKSAELIATGTYRDARTALYDHLAVMIEYNSNSIEDTNNAGTQQFQTSIRLIIAVIVLADVITILFAIIIIRSITTGITEMKRAAAEIAAKDLTVELSEKLLKRKDEVGQLSDALNTMKNNMHTIIGQIVSSSSEMESMTNESNEKFTQLNDYIQEISSATEELSAGMEETAASSEELNATMQEIDNAVEMVSAKAADGAKMADGIAGRASELKVNFTESKHHSDVTFTTIQSSLLKSLEDAKAVEQINSLADAILSITNQTNLLALNAAIEAARAGDAGKGFAVVADEIRNLAENSKGTATQILEIASIVVKSVDLLVSDANKLLGFVEKDVSSDYNTMLNATDDYNGAASDVNDMTSDLSATAEELQASIQTVLTTIHEVSRAATEGAATTTNIAEQVSEVTINADTVMKNLNQTKDSALALNELVKEFKI